jgi:hypothetical protein
MPVSNDKIKVLFDAVSSDYEIGTIDEFKTKMQDPEKRKAFYTGIGKEYDLGENLDVFESKLGFKKKDGGVSPAPLPISGTPAESPLPLPSVGVDPIELQKRYERVGGGTSYLNDLIGKRKSADPVFAPLASDMMRSAASFNEQGKKVERTNLVYDFLEKNFDVNTNDNTRDAFVSSQYAGTYYSESPDLKYEYDKSDLKSVLTPRQFSGLKSLSFGKQSQFLESSKKLADPTVDQKEKDIIKLELDKVGIGIDKDAAASIAQQGLDMTMAEGLYQKAKNDESLVEEALRNYDLENPYTVRSFTNIIKGASERGYLVGERADILTATSDETGIDVDRLAYLQGELKNSKASKAYEQFSQNPTLDNFKKNPIGIMLELSLESLAALYTHGATRIGAGVTSGATVGSVIPGFGTAAGASYGAIVGTGLSSLNLEYSSSILEGLDALGVNTSDAEQLRNAFANEETMSKLKRSAYAKGIPVAVFDMISGGVAGKILSKPAKTLAGRVTSAVAETAVQAGLGAVGEATGQIVEQGKIYSPSAVLMEALGELGPGTVEITYGTMVESAKRNQKPSTGDVVAIVESMPKERINENLDTQVSAGIITPDQANIVRNEVARVETLTSKMPSDITVDAKSQIVDLLQQKADLQQKAKTLDDAFKADVEQQISQIDQQIVQITQTDRNATLQSARQQQAVSPEGGVQERPGTDGGQQEVGQGARQQGQAPVEGTDTGDSVRRSEEEVGTRLAGELSQELQQDYQPIIDRASKAYSSANVSFEVLDDAEFVARTGNTEAEGAFISTDKSGKIILNRQKMEAAGPGVIIWHEAAHPVMNTIRNTDRPLYDKMVSGLKQLAQTNQQLAGALQWADQYAVKIRETGGTEQAARETADDEAVVESIAQISASPELLASLPRSIKQTMIEFINSVAKMLGIKGRIADVDDTATFRRMAREISRALKEGRDISEIVGAENVGRVRGLGVSAQFRSPEPQVDDSPVFFENAKDFANKSSFSNKVKFKEAIQKMLKDNIPSLRKKYGKGFDPSQYNDTTFRYLSDVLTKESVNAIGQHPEAIGWYDEKTQSALAALSAVHPEIATDMEARGAFIAALAIMSNGNKVDKNFELAEQQYRTYKETGRFDSSGEFGAQQVGIKKSLKLINEMLDSGLTMGDINNFFTSKYRAGDLKYKDASGKSKSLVSGELANEQVYGAVVLGPKIGNGFYMNLWGEFGQLTMDRWFMRTWGRLTGTLIEKDPDQIKQSRERLTDSKNKIPAGSVEYKSLVSIVGPISKLSVSDLAIAIQKASADKKSREILQSNAKLDELRKAANNLAKKESGEKEAPANGAERKFIRDVFEDIKRRLSVEHGVDITMADLQAVLWYPEKILYESFKEGESFEDASSGYTEDSAPDYLNSAKKLSIKLGATNEQINAAVSERRRVSGESSGTRPSVGSEGAVRSGKDALSTISDIKRSEKKSTTQFSLGNRQAIIDKAKADGTYLKAPNGQPTKLTEDQWTTVRTPEFKNWFGDWENDPQNASKVVDNNGEPMVVYHGAREAGFDRFADTEGRKQSQAPDGSSFFTTSRDVARSYSGTNKEVQDFGLEELDSRGGIYSVFLNIRSEYGVDFGGANWDGFLYGKFEVYNEETGETEIFDSMSEAENYADENGIDYSDIREDPFVGQSTNEFVSDAMRAGVDGAIMYSVIDTGSRSGYDVESDVYVAFNPNQIKSATANVGAFSTEDNRIQFSMGGRPKVGKINWEKSPEGKGDPSISSRNPIVVKAAQDLKNALISNEEYRATVSENSPIGPITRFFEPATLEEMRRALDSNKAVRVEVPIEDGVKVALRLDIPAYLNNNTWVVSIHDGTIKQGKSISYTNVARITNVLFGTEPKAALNISGGIQKTAIGRMYGDYQNIPGETTEERGENAKRLVQEIVDDPNYVQVGMNPFRHSYFYDRNTDMGRPIKSADEVIQVGGLVYAKNPVYGEWTDEAYRVAGLFDSTGAAVQFSMGNRPEQRREFKLVAFVLRKKAEGYTDGQIAFAINSALPTMTPQEVLSLLRDPKQYLQNAFPGMTSLQYANLLRRAEIVNIYRPRGFTPKVTEMFLSMGVDQEVLDRYYMRVKTRRQVIAETIDNWFKKGFDPAKGLPKWVLEAKEMARGARNLEIAQAKKTLDKLAAVSKKIGFDDWELFKLAMKSVDLNAGNTTMALAPYAPSSAPLSGLSLEPPVRANNPVLARLPLEIQPFVTRMRNQIDGLSNKLVAGGFVNPAVAVAIEKNLGQYITRSYRLFNEKGFTPDPKAYNAAVDYLANEEYRVLLQEFYDKNVKPELPSNQARIGTDQESGQQIDIPYADLMVQAVENAKRRVDDIITRKDNPYFGSGSVESRDTGILKTRKFIPVAIRELMGEYTDPGITFMMTVAKQASLAASSQFLKDLRKQGLGTMFFEKNDPNRPQGFNTPIAGEKSSALEPLNGLYTTAEIYEALQDAEVTRNRAVQFWMKVVSTNRWFKTVGSIRTQFVNFESNLGFAVMNGLIFTKEGRPLGRAMAESKSYVSGQYRTETEMSEITKKAIALGLVGQDIDINAIKQAFKENDMFEMALDVALTDKGIFKKVSKKVRPMAEFNKLYRMGDDFWKVYGYMSERAQIAKLRFGGQYESLTSEQQDAVDREAADRVKDTWPTYDRMWNEIRSLSQNIPILGNFVAFQAESMRVMINAGKLVAKDMKDPQMQTAAMRRAGGMLAYVGIRTAITTAVPLALGYGVSGVIGELINDDEEEDKKWALKEVSPLFMRTGDIIAYQSKDKPHMYTVIDMLSIDPLGIPARSINAFTEGTETFDPGIVASVSELIGGFLEREMTFKLVEDLANNYNSRNGLPIWNSEDKRAERVGKVADYAWQSLKPSTWGLIERAISNENKIAEATAFGGFRPYEVDLHKSFDISLSKMQNSMSEISREYGAISRDEKRSDQEKEEARIRAGEKKASVIAKYHRLYSTLIKLGADPEVMEEIVNSKSSIKMTGMDKKTKAAIIDGEVDPTTLY